MCLFMYFPTQAFFAKDYIANHPEDGEKITRLRELMFEQVQKQELFGSVMWHSYFSVYLKYIFKYNIYFEIYIYILKNIY